MAARPVKFDKHSTRRLAVLAATAVAFLSVPSGLGAATIVPSGFADQQMVAGLQDPTSLAFTSDGRIFITEQRRGWIRMVVSGQLASTDPVLAIPDVTGVEWERGVQGIAVDPGWPGRPYVYIYYTRLGGDCALVRYTAFGDVDEPLGQNITLGDPFWILDNIPDVEAVHNGGCLRFSPSGHLFVSLGDDLNDCAAQDSTSLRGQLLRLDVSALPDGPGGPPGPGTITPVDNPLDSTDPHARLVYAYGLRNPWRFQIDPASGDVFVSDVGEDLFEEVNEVRPGANLGWPHREGLFIRTFSLCPEPGGPGGSPYDPPFVDFGHEDGLAVLAAGVYRRFPSMTYPWPPAYDGDFFFSDFAGGFLRRLRRADGGWIRPPMVTGQPDVVNWAIGLNYPADFQVGPDGHLWWLSRFNPESPGDAGVLRRIVYLGGAVAVSGGESVKASVDAVPNPFRTSTTVTLRAAGPGPTRVCVYDVSGRRIATLAEGLTGPGPLRVAWNGRADDGRDVPAGVYIVRLERADLSVSARVLRIR